jgi:hypothetical protein
MVSRRSALEHRVRRKAHDARDGEWSLPWNQALETGGALLGNKVKIALEIAAARK